MSEGSLEAPIRHVIPWQDPDFYDEEKLDAELRRVFDICHGCRRCFNLCDSFPRLFDLIDESESGELDTVDSADFKPVVDACTLCDMCFLTKCPYVPPHEFNLDFPHLMLRARAIDQKKGKVPFAAREMTKTDRNGKLASAVAPAVNWACKCDNGLTRPAMESLAGIHRDAKLPEFHAKTFQDLAKTPPAVDPAGPAHGRKAVLYATCFANFNNPGIGTSAQAVLAKNGVETEVVYPRCCGMPQLEQGDIAAVAEAAREVSAELCQWIDKGYEIIGLVPSCALMMKFEWPLILPDDENVKKLAAHTSDITEYVVAIAKKEGLADGMTPLAGGVTAHIACHARAQNMGQKGAEMLRLVPDTDVKVIERCSGHGGSWGVTKEFFEVGLKVGKPAARQAAKNETPFVVSECPLARDHIIQGMERLDADVSGINHAQHPIELMAIAYGLKD
ncbi:glycerol-3-phosphate dehydrogenase [bacterium SCSIO 12827]|nr:glycerol-3-phosphate dehydrogenase [bacterium SCSIO 12827]